MANNTLCELTIADFPLINLNDLIIVTEILGYLNNDQVQDKSSYIIRYSHIKSFIDFYFDHLRPVDFEFVTSF